MTYNILARPVCPFIILMIASSVGRYVIPLFVWKPFFGSTGTDVFISPDGATDLNGLFPMTFKPSNIQFKSHSVIQIFVLIQTTTQQKKSVLDGSNHFSTKENEMNT